MLTCSSVEVSKKRHIIMLQAFCRMGVISVEVAKKAVTTLKDLSK